jgi:hypothetical protein
MLNQILRLALADKRKKTFLLKKTLFTFSTCFLQDGFKFELLGPMLQKPEALVFLPFVLPGYHPIVSLDFFVASAPQTISN